MKLITRSLLIFCGFTLGILTSCAPTADTISTSPDNPTLLANLIKTSNPTISSLTVTSDNSDPSSPKLTITGITNSASGSPFTAAINIDQDKGITTDPASFTVTARSLISPDTVMTPLTVTFEGEVAVSYTATTEIKGAAVGDWIVNEKLDDYISVSFADQTPTLSITDTTLSITGLTNIPDSPTGDGGMIAFKKLPAGFTVEPSSITFPNPDGTGAAMSTPDPHTFAIAETGNTANAGTYTIAAIDLAKLTRFTPSLHIKVAEGSTDITSSLTITEEENNMIRIAGLTNKLDQISGTPNEYTLTIDEEAELFTISGGADIPITRTIVEPMEDFFPAPASVITPSNTFDVLNSDESAPTMYTLVVDFNGAAPNDWFTATYLNTYITGASFQRQVADTLAFDGTTITISHSDSANNFTNVPNGTISLTVGTLLTGYELVTNALMDPDGMGLAAVTRGDAGMITIVETANPTNKEDYPVTITLAAYRSPLMAENISATYGGETPAEKATSSPSDITIATNIITISGFTNNTGILESGTVTFAAPDDYTITPTTLPISDPTGENATNEEIGMITVTDATGLAVPHLVTVDFLDMLQLRVTGDGITGSPLTVNSGDTISITTAVCELLAQPTVTVIGVDGSKIADATPFPLYYDRERDSLSSGKFKVTRKLILEDGNANVLSMGFLITVEIPECTSFAGGTGDAPAHAYEIDNAPRLELVSYLINNSNVVTGVGSTETYGGAYYKITEDIDMGLPGLPFSEMGSKTPDAAGLIGKGFLPIGRTNRNTNLRGTFDCASNTISGLYINRPNTDDIGLIGYASNTSIIQNCFVIDVNVIGRDNVGGLIGTKEGVLSNSYSTGRVSGAHGVGGLVGNNNNSYISNSYSTATVSGNSNIGGLVGDTSLANISNSYATGSVTGDEHIGGLIGSLAEGSPATVSDSYAIGSVTGKTNVGGLIGLKDSISPNDNSIVNSYAIGTVSGNTRVGLFIGYNKGDSSTTPIRPIKVGVTNSYYNNESILMVGDSTVTAKGVGSDGGSVTTTGLTGLSALQLQVVKGTMTGETYFTWDDAIWDFTSGKYPRLKTVVCANRQYNQAATDCTSTLQ